MQPSLVPPATPARQFDRVCDIVAQAGVGERRTPLGWRREDVSRFVQQQVRRDPRISARSLAKRIVDCARQIDGGEAKDDITCGVLYVCEPRRLLVVTGPPFSPAADAELGRMVEQAPGQIAICGGTTANIVSRTLHRTVEMDLGTLDPEIPPAGIMPGIDLVTEGTLTLRHVAAWLEQRRQPDELRRNPATRLTELLLASDIIQFVVGTRINQAHQDPNIPAELDLRRNIVRRISNVLQAQHGKTVQIRYL